MDCKLVVALLLAFFGLGAAVPHLYNKKTCPKPTPPTDSFQVDQFMGLWYEIERSFEPWELEWDCASFNYSRVGEHNFTVDINGIKSHKPVVHHGKANNKHYPYVLELTFGTFDVPDPQWIVEFDQKQGSALVMTCFNIKGVNLYFAWIFSRTKSLDVNTVKEMKKKLDLLGMDSNFMKPVNQKCLANLG